jgi:hypothetical protein
MAGADIHRTEIAMTRTPPTAHGRRIPEFLDPTFGGEPKDDSDEPNPVEQDVSDVLQMPVPPSPLDVLRDPEDEPLDLPAEEGAMHIVVDRPAGGDGQ